MRREISGFILKVIKRVLQVFNVSPNIHGTQHVQLQCGGVHESGPRNEGQRVHAIYYYAYRPLKINPFWMQRSAVSAPFQIHIKATKIRYSLLHAQVNSKLTTRVRYSQITLQMCLQTRTEYNHVKVTTQVIPTIKFSHTSWEIEKSGKGVPYCRSTHVFQTCSLPCFILHWF